MGRSVSTDTSELEFYMKHQTTSTYFHKEVQLVCILLEDLAVESFISGGKLQKIKVVNSVFPIHYGETAYNLFICSIYVSSLVQAFLTILLNNVVHTDNQTNNNVLYDQSHQEVVIFHDSCSNISNV